MKASDMNPANAELARNIFQSAPKDADWKVVAERMYRALLGGDARVFVARRQGIKKGPCYRTRIQTSVAERQD